MKLLKRWWADLILNHTHAGRVYQMKRRRGDFDA